MRVRWKSSSNASLLGMAMLAFMSTTGCELATEVDRSQIPDGNGGGGSTSSSSSSSSSSSGSMAECTEATVDTDCPDPMNECVVRTCVEGVCGTMPVPVGTALAMQTDGDCKLAVCDGNGATTTQDADTDLPNDGNDCTDDSCNMGQPVYTNKVLDTACGAGGALYCDGNGACVGCTADSQCGTATDCSTPKCDAAHTCTTVFTAVGTPTPNQTMGDCQEEQCDGIGGTKMVPATTDINNDNNACTDDACDGSTPTHTNSPSGTTCTNGASGQVCNGAGACVECLTGTQCASQVCAADQTCAAPTCTDTVANGNETDVDCGGADCTGCALGLMCKIGSDCLSTFCANGLCVDAICGDGIVSGAEGCDDGNLNDGDGCSSGCTVDPGYSCTGSPSVCGLPETNCSDGKDNDGDGQVDGADSDCQLPSYFLPCAPGESLFVFRSSDPVTPIPNYQATYQSDLDVSGTNGIVMKTAMFFNVTHPYDGDVLMGLVPTDGNLYYAVNQQGASGANFTNTILDSTCPTSITTISAAGAPFSNCYSPEDSLAPMVGQAADGLWSLLITDVYAASDDGTLDNWGLALCVAPTPVCGNGAVEFGEICDDSNTANGDGCSSTCTVEAGYQCTGAPSVCTASVCGNGVIESGEICDDNNTANGDGCSSACVVEPNYTCSGTPSVCVSHETACSDGTDNDGDGQVDSADTDCQLPAYFKPCGGGEKLYVFHSSDPSTAIPYDPTTFDSVITVGNTSGSGIITKAAIMLDATHTYVGDINAVLTGPDGAIYNAILGEGAGGQNFTATVLDSTCTTSITTISSADAPFSACYSPEDSFGPLVGATADGTWTLSVTDTYPSLDDGTLDDWTVAVCVGPLPVCGNGILQSGEGCDDNNTNDGDGCSSTCTVEPGYNCSGSPSVCSAFVCGDGAVNGAEECDDSNTNNNDGCSSTCTIEADYKCTGAPSTCLPYETICNDNLDNDGDGNIDAADSDCALPAYFPGCTGGQTLRVYKSFDTPIAIPDNDLTGIFSSVHVVNNVGNIANGALLLNVAHTYDGDVVVTLLAPNNASYDITLNNGGSGDNYIDTIFSATCPPVSGGAPPYSDCYAPDGDITPLLGMPGQGTWQLNAADTDLFISGTLTNWALVLCTQ